MLEYERKRKIRRFLYSKVTLLLLCVAIGFLGKGAYNIYEKVRESQKDREIAQGQLQKLIEREVIVTAQVADLLTEQGIEREIREKFNVAKEGESMIVLVEGDAPVEEEKEEGVLNELWLKIKGVFN